MILPLALMPTSIVFSTLRYITLGILLSRFTLYFTGPVCRKALRMEWDGVGQIYTWSHCIWSENFEQAKRIRLGRNIQMH